MEGSSSAPTRLSSIMTPQECEPPLIDLHRLSSAREAERQLCAEAICEAAAHWGFFQVVHHGISSELLGKMRRELVKLFGAPFDTKAHPGLLNNSYRRGTPPAPSLARFSGPEAFHVPFMKVYDPSCCGPFTSLGGVMRELAPAMFGLARTLAVVLAESLGHQGRRSTFNEKCDESTCFLRLNHYPVCPLSPQTYRPVPPVDSDFLTILYPDQVGGIRLRKDSRWVMIKPNRDALIVSTGDLLQAWSNDVYRSVEQKVQTNSEVERYTVVFSLCPSSNSQIGHKVGLPRFRQTERKISSDLSTELTLQWHPWKIKKKLMKSDIDDLSRLLLLVSCLRTHVFQQMDEEMLMQVKSKEGMPVVGIDADTGDKHQFVFRCWGSSGSYVLNGGWTKEFVEKKGLKVGNEIGMVWDMSSRKFYFEVLHRAAPQL